MGAVYAGEIMTIIAYAGDDPTFGLPGISSNIDRTITWPIKQAIRYLGLSTWLTRGCSLLRSGWYTGTRAHSTRKLFVTLNPVLKLWEEP
jgi:hypothetical protein